MGEKANEANCQKEKKKGIRNRRKRKQQGKKLLAKIKKRKENQEKAEEEGTGEAPWTGTPGFPQGCQGAGSHWRQDPGCGPPLQEHFPLCRCPLRSPGQLGGRARVPEGLGAQPPELILHVMFPALLIVSDN